MDSPRLRLSRVDVDLVRRVVIERDGTERALTEQHVDLLTELAKVRGRSVNRADLARKVGVPAGGSALRVAVHRLREVVGDDAHADVLRSPSGYALALPPPEERPATPRERLVRGVRMACRAGGWTLDEGEHGPTRAHVRGVEVGLAPLYAWVDDIPRHAEFTRLPPLLGADRGLPIESMYVTLSVSPSPPTPDVASLSRRLSLAEAVGHRRSRRLARRVAVEAMVDHPSHRRQVVLGDPGSGKSSLLRRIALEVAKGSYARWALPLPVNLPDWRAAWRRAGSALDPVDMRLGNLLTGAPGRASVVAYGPVWAERAAEIRALRELLEAFPDGSGVLVLADAFDEIAADGEAVDAATAALAAAGERFGVLVASRPAGFFGGLGEDERYELSELDDDGVESLVRRWFGHQEPARPLAADTLLSQVGKSPRLHEMGRNPFLLTLLCQLQLAATLADEELMLPLYRSEVYARILLLAARQAQARTKDPTCLDAECRDRLARFCGWLLSDAAAAPRHLFSEDDWGVFQPPAPALAQRILPGRLVARWTEEGDYHLVHLTLHEYLAAVDAVADVDRLIERRFRPGWRVPLRFAGALLMEAGRRDDLARLLRALREPRELLGRTEVEAAWVLLDAGIEDTRELLGIDLRERLWSVWGERQTSVAEHAGEALAILAPRWLVRRAVAVLEGRAAMPERAAATRTTLESWFDDVADEDRQADRAALVRLLAQVADPTVEDLLLGLAATADEWMANAAMDALSTVGTRRVREGVKRLAAGSAGDALAWRISRFVGRVGDPAFRPWLLDELRTRSGRRRLAAVEALALLGDAESARELLRWGGDRRDEESEELVAEALAGIAGSGGAGAARPEIESFFRERIDEARGKRRKLAAWVGYAIRAGVLTDDEVAAFLSQASTAGIAREEVRDAADGSRVFGEAVRTRLVAAWAGGDELAFEALGKVVGMRAARGGHAEDAAMFRAALAHPSEDVRAAAADTLGLLEDTGALPALLALVEDPDESVVVRINALVALRAVAAEVPVEALVRLVVEDPIEDIGILAAEVLLAVGLEAWALVRRHPRALAALAGWIADRPELVFEDYWVDRHGNVRPWP